MTMTFQFVFNSLVTPAQKSELSHAKGRAGGHARPPRPCAGGASGGESGPGCRAGRQSRRADHRRQAAAGKFHVGIF